MIVDEACFGIRGVEVIGGKVLRCLQRHMAAIAILLCFFGVIETARVVARYAAQEKGVVMILTAEEFLVLGKLLWKGNFVARGTELRGLHERLEESFLME